MSIFYILDSKDSNEKVDMFGMLEKIGIFSDLSSLYSQLKKLIDNNIVQKDNKIFWQISPDDKMEPIMNIGVFVEGFECIVNEINKNAFKKMLSSYESNSFILKLLEELISPQNEPVGSQKKKIVKY